MKPVIKKILILNVYFPEIREPIKRINEAPNTLAPTLLGGFFDRENCEVKLYNEVTSGFIEIFDPELLSWPDVLVLTSLSAAFDRLLHVTAYAKTANPEVIVAAGGHAVRSLPHYAKQFFDYTCVGDVEEIKDVIMDALGCDYLSKVPAPRYDLTYWMKKTVYAESTRNCNFKCSFCSLTGVGLKYKVQSEEYLQSQLDSIGKRLWLIFNDNQLAGSGLNDLKKRLAGVQRKREAGQLKFWTGFFTDSFFWNPDNVKFLQESGCLSVFVGVESFADSEWLNGVNKKQNSRKNQVDLIRNCMDEGVLFQYGLVFDPSTRSTADMHREMEIICANAEIPPPNFIFMSIPFPGTPFFKDRLLKGQILPGTKMRDFEASTLTLKPIDSVDDVVHFIKNGRNFKGYRRRFLTHHIRHLWRYRKSLHRYQILFSVLTALAIFNPTKFFSPSSLFVKKRVRTHVSTTDHLDPVYTPCLPVANCYRHYFEATVVVDANGELNPLLVQDILGTDQIQPATVPLHLEAVL